MSLDAIINKVIPDGPHLTLELMSREDVGSRGQPTLTIKNYTHRPVAGQALWGGAGTVIIEPGEGIDGQGKYKRSGYTTLTEDFDEPKTNS